MTAAVRRLLATHRYATDAIGLGCACLMLVLTNAATADETSARGISRYIPLTTSRVVGSPQPPPPYRAEAAYPDWKMTWPVYMEVEPGARRMIFLDQQQSSGPSRVARTIGEPGSGEVETLLEKDAILYSLAFHPRFEENGWIYLGLNGPLASKPRRSQIVRYTIAREPPYALAVDSEQLITQWESDGHNGVALAFGLDAMLYITSGDGTSDSDTDLAGQGLDHLLAKVLRIDVDSPTAERAYSIPEDNPFVGQQNVRPETWAYGLRNPWRITVDPKTGAIWVGNNGQDLWEQIYRLQRGANYGWSVFEGSQPFYRNRQLGPTPHVLPTLEHPHSEARSLTGGVVYYGKAYPELHGAYIYGDYSTGKIWGARHDGAQTTWHRELADTTLAITAISLDPDGELLIADHRGNDEGGFYRLVPSEEPAHDPAAFPRTLSESGLFASVSEHRVQPALIPYSVNAPLWSDGTYKERYMALPGEAPKIGLRPDHGWDFPEGTVFVKSFALQPQEHDPATRRWIETRLFTKQQGEWAGYSYAWNDQQTDATLVAAEGADREFRVQSDNGERAQSWRYPSRTECMLCHSRAANFVLGPSTLQMNKDHDYDGVVDNQLRVLEHLGLVQLADKTPQDHPRLVNPYDEAQDLEMRARSYLHANCSSCHIGAGGGNAQIDLAFTTRLEKTNAVDAKPLHDNFGIGEARIIAPGAPERSVLLHRMSIRGRGQMPQLATEIPDLAAADLIRRWIQSLPAPSAEADRAASQEAAP